MVLSSSLDLVVTVTQVVAKATQISMAPAAWLVDPKMDSGGSPAHWNQQGTQHNRSHGHQQRPWLPKDQGPRHGPWQQPGRPGHHHSPRWQADSNTCPLAPSSFLPFYIFPQNMNHSAFLPLPSLHQILPKVSKKRRGKNLNAAVNP